MAEIKIENNNTDNILDALKEATHNALLDVGMIASGDIIDFITDRGIVDTGLLGNSITFALNGESANISSYKSNPTDKNGKPVPTVEGSYNGKAPNKENTVYIGTNVEYAKYVQYGTSKMKKRDFMFAPLRANMDEYRNIIKKYL